MQTKVEGHMKMRPRAMQLADGKQKANACKSMAVAYF